MEKSNAARLPVLATVNAVLLTAVLSLLPVAKAWGDDEMRSLELFNGSTAEVVSGSRSPRPASQTAENTTVVTAEEIEGLNAHTLADVLYVVAGVQQGLNRTPGTSTNIEVQGSDFDHVLVLVDNVSINNLADNFPDIASVPVQMIERIEIVKGAASSSWGSALGGVINVITKIPQQDGAAGGMLSGSYGSRQTADGRGEVSGALDRFGYYFNVGKMRSDGLLPNNESDLRSWYGKLRYDFPLRGSVTLSTLFTEAYSGQVSVRGVDIDQESRQVLSSLSVQYQLANRVTLEAVARTRRNSMELFRENAATGDLLQSSLEDDTDNGGSIKLSWLGESQLVVAGVDYDHMKSLIFVPQLGEQLRRADRTGYYLNDTITVGNFAITPSARFDETGVGERHFSPSFGVTYALTENSVLRGYTARGYSLTSLNRSDSTEKVWTSQLGFETGDVPYLWLKGTLFRNDTWDITTNGTTLVTEQRQLKQGVELEARTLPVYNTSLLAGYTFISATRGDSGPVISGVPKHTLKLNLRYQDPDDLRAELVGTYVHWNDPAGRYGSIIWDLYLRKVLDVSEDLSFELFASVRNLLNGEQYPNSFFKNNGRWAEGGIRCNF